MEGTMANITLFAADFAPRNWAYCDGSILSIAGNPALFSLLGITYGGNGQTTFALPDLRSRFPIGTGQGPGLSDYSLGEMGGTEQNTMTMATMPAHNHAASVMMQASVNADSSDTDTPENTVYGAASEAIYSTVPGAGQYFGPLHVTSNLSVTGGSAPIANLMPYLALNYVICMYGIFPSRS